VLSEAANGLQSADTAHAVAAVRCGRAILRRFSP
jgi:hypothetical protein